PLTETTAMITSFTKNINIFLLYHPELDIKLKFMRMLYINILRQKDKRNRSGQKETLKRGISCGHRKSNNYDKELFLNPFEEKNIESFFVYYSDRENSKESKGVLISESKNPEHIKRAQYMIEEVLDLNHDRLKKLREAVYNNFLLETDDGLDEEEVKYLLRENNIDKLYEFHSMLKYFFKYLF
ncbi:MAG: hypothetical protein ACTSWX_07575, partial [Promethearchaeota archaeon]